MKIKYLLQCIHRYLLWNGQGRSLLPTTEALGQLKWHWFQQENQLIDFEVIDAASRGFWGSALLLLKSKSM